MVIGDLVRCKVDDGEGVGIVDRFINSDDGATDVHVIWANGWGPFWYRYDELVKV